MYPRIYIGDLLVTVTSTLRPVDWSEAREGIEPSYTGSCAPGALPLGYLAVKLHWVRIAPFPKELFRESLEKKPYALFHMILHTQLYRALVSGSYRNKEGNMSNKLRC